MYSNIIYSKQTRNVMSVNNRGWHETKSGTKFAFKYRGSEKKKTEKTFRKNYIFP